MGLQALLSEALKLPEDERAEFAGQLLRSLEPEGDVLSGEAWEASWAAELERRLRDLESGHATLIDGDDAIRQVRARIQSRRR